MAIIAGHLLLNSRGLNAREKAHKTKGGKVVRYRRLPFSKGSAKKGKRTP